MAWNEKGEKQAHTVNITLEISDNQYSPWMEIDASSSLPVRILFPYGILSDADGLAFRVISSVGYFAAHR